MDTELIQGIKEMDAILTILRCGIASVDPQMRNIARKLNNAFTALQQTMNLDLANRRGQITVDDATLKGMATDGILLFIEALTYVQAQARESSDPMAKVCDSLCTKLLQDLTCQLTELRAKTGTHGTQLDCHA